MEYMDKMLEYVTMQFVGHFGHGVSPMRQGVPHELGHYMAPWSILTIWLMVIPSIIRILIMVIINPYEPLDD
jgi:hypothetical protein